MSKKCKGREYQVGERSPRMACKWARGRSLLVWMAEVMASLTISRVYLSLMTWDKYFCESYSSSVLLQGSSSSRIRRDRSSSLSLRGIVWLCVMFLNLRFSKLSLFSSSSRDSTLVSVAFRSSSRVFLSCLMVWSFSLDSLDYFYDKAVSSGLGGWGVVLGLDVASFNYFFRVQTVWAFQWRMLWMLVSLTRLNERQSSLNLKPLSILPRPFPALPTTSAFFLSLTQASFTLFSAISPIFQAPLLYSNLIPQSTFVFSSAPPFLFSSLQLHSTSLLKPLSTLLLTILSNFTSSNTSLNCLFSFSTFSTR